MKIGVTGGNGNLGKVIISEGKKLDYDMNIIESSEELEKSNCDVYIDCTNRLAFLNNLEIYFKKLKPIVIATTGFNEEDEIRIKELSKYISIMKVTNFCIGAYKYLKLIEEATKLYGLEYDIVITDKHQKYKKDNISGTAYNIEKSIHNIIPEKKVSFSSIRAGGIVAEHETIFVNDNNEQIIISHKIFNRETFAIGALKATFWIKDKLNGIYILDDML
ncbi:MAG: dihydrodipicolinate reductase C-terminal domain-containing protein [Clostridia bacterium]